MHTARRQETGDKSCSYSDLLNKLRSLDAGSGSSGGDSPRVRSMSTGAASPRPCSSSSSSSPFNGAVARRPQVSAPKPALAAARRSPPLHASPSRVRFSDSLPNGSLVSARSAEGAGFGGRDRDLCRDRRRNLDTESTDNVANSRLESGCHGNLHKTFSDDTHNFASSLSSKALLPKENSVVRSLLHKTRSYQDHLCSVDVTLEGPVCLEAMTKEELLLLWKTSELDLSRKLDKALREKARLEKKLALLQYKQSPV